MVAFEVTALIAFRSRGATSKDMAVLVPPCKSFGQSESRVDLREVGGVDGFDLREGGGGVDCFRLRGMGAAS